jgi:molybdenum cofactor cytidylyltransferase
MRPVVGLLLAAGSGRRFGSDKLLATLPDGRAVGQAAAVHLRAGVDTAIAIVRPGAPRLTAVLADAGLEVVTNPLAEDGMAGSIALGVTATAGAAGWLITLADMPWVLPETITAVADALRNGASIAAPYHQGRRGHPVGLHRRWIDELRPLRGDRGARALLERHADQLVAVTTNDPGVLRDIDRPEDLGLSPGVTELALGSPGDTDTSVRRAKPF